MSASVEPVRSVVAEAVSEVTGFDVPEAGDASLQDLEVDSLGLIEVGMIVEERFDIVVDAERFERVVTFNQAVEVFERLIVEQRAGRG